MLRLLLIVICFPVFGSVKTGVDVFFAQEHYHALAGQRVGLITNHTGFNSRLESTIDLFKKHEGEYQFVALFAPEHGIRGICYAEEHIEHAKDCDGIPIHSLHGATRRPTEEMLRNIDVLVFDIQDIGTRTYTFASTLLCAMEEAAKYGIRVVVLDRPNPINGVIVDGPMMDPQWRSFIGYLDVPLCHGFTMGELARYFNGEYQIGCDLHVVKMENWQREMSFEETGLPWTPTSPHIPNSRTALFYPTTNMIGEILKDVSVGVGYTLPFEVIGAPWIDAEKFAAALNEQDFAGVRFQPFYFRPFFGRHKARNCAGVRIVVTDVRTYRPVATQFLILGVIKSLYPAQFEKRLDSSKEKRLLVCKVSGSSEVDRIVQEEKYLTWQLIAVDKGKRDTFLKTRDKYLLY